MEVGEKPITDMDIGEECVPDEGTVAIMPETNSRVWLKQEDDMLLSLVQLLQPKKWTHIAKELNQALYGGSIVKTPKQCRERWHNHLNPDLKKGNWTI
jgi:hypothetical protein